MRHRPNRSRKRMSRRMLLKGAGTIAIGLPFLEEFMGPARADEGGGIPCRLYTMSFGLGLDATLQAEEFAGPLESFEPFADKTAFFRRIDGSALAAAGTPHYSISASTFTGVPQLPADSDYHAGGPSMEQVMKRALHPMGVPNVSVPELSAGLWSRTAAVSQFTRHWNADGSPGQRPERRPTRVFNLLFGSYDNPGALDDAQLAVRNHVRRSVLDTVLEQYNELTGPTSYLGTASKQRIDNHLAAIRDVETQLTPTGIAGPALDCTLPAQSGVYDPSPYDFYDAAAGAGGPGAPLLDWQVAQDAMRLIGELYAIGTSCDAIRFGSLVCIGGGGHVRFSGLYSALGQSFDFTEEFASGAPHERIFHGYQRDKIRMYQHFIISSLTHMLRAMDAITEANGRTVLDNSLVLVGTEYGENHSAVDTFHAVVGGGGRFNPGWYDQVLLPSDVYHQALDAYGVDSGIRDRWPDYSPTEIIGFRTS